VSEEQKHIRPKAVLVGLQLPNVSDIDHRASLEELSRLVHTLGFDVIATVSQKRTAPVTATVVGGGKLKELARLTGGTGIVESKVPAKSKKGDKSEDLEDDEPYLTYHTGEEEVDETAHIKDRAEKVVFDSELTPNQLRNIETATGVEVLDRTGVIVEIFHRHAKTKEARIQVEIARLKYLAPRLRFSRHGGDRQGGGIGAKGAGETSLELDKRRIRDRIAELSRELKETHVGQAERRQRRDGQLKIALVGYTNAGKSSLMRALTGSEVLVEDKLFATLDTTIRVLQPESQPRILVSDTVGFIKKLPHDLVASFRSTLDEAADASLLLFVVDASDPTFRAQYEVTKEVLTEIDAAHSPSLLILNKVDRLTSEEIRLLKAEYPGSIALSARKPDDVKMLRELIIGHFEKEMQDQVLDIPYAKSALLGEIRKTMRVVSELHGEEGTAVTVRGYKEQINRILKKLKSE
jgi:GTP-binding protein HflX